MSRVDCRRIEHRDFDEVDLVFDGGINPFGGFGRVIPVFVALVVLQLLSSGLNLMGANQHLATAVWGLLLVGVMILRWVASHYKFPTNRKG